MTRPHLKQSKIPSGSVAGQHFVSDGSNWVITTPPVAGTASFSGSGYEYVEDLTGATLVGIYSYTEVFSYTTSVLDAGDYVIEWSFRQFTPNTGPAGGQKIRMELDNFPLAPLDPAQWINAAPEQNEFFIHSGFATASVTNATHSIDIDAISGGDDLTIDNIHIAIWKVPT